MRQKKFWKPPPLRTTSASECALKNTVTATALTRRWKARPSHSKCCPRAVYTHGQTERICYLIGHHHTYTNINGIDYQILVEADFLVNIFESGMTHEAAEKVYENIFRTKTGKQLLKDLFL